MSSPLDTVSPKAPQREVRERESPDTTTVLGKVGCILEAFTTDNASLGISEISRTTGISKATVHRLCCEMTELGLLDRDWSQFQLGMRLFELGSMVQSQRVLRDVATPFLQDLRAKTNETIHLGIPADGHVLYVVRLTGHQSQEAPSRVAGRAPMHCTATGKAMLAHLPSQLVESLVSRPLKKYTRYTTVSRELLEAELIDVRKNGFAIQNQETTMGFCSVGAPIFGPGRRLLGAVAVTGPIRRVNIDTSALKVRQTADRISAQAATNWDLA